MILTPCAREWRLNGVTVTDMANSVLVLHHDSKLII